MAFNWKSEYHRYQRYFVNLETLYRKRSVIVYTGITLSMLAIAFFTFFALKPTANVIFSLLSDLREKKIISQQLQAKINALALAQTNYSTQTELLNLVNEALPNNPSLPEIAKYFETLFTQENLIVRDITYDQIVYSQKQDSIAFNFTVQGNYENLKNALEKIENLRRIIILESFTFSLASIENPETLNLTVKGRAFYYPLEKAI